MVPDWYKQPRKSYSLSRVCSAPPQPAQSSKEGETKTRGKEKAFQEKWGASIARVGWVYLEETL